jgi:hypothetical protein
LWSVGQGLRPAEFHEKQWQAEAKVFDRSCVSGLCIFNDLSWFFDPASAAQQPTPNPSTTRLGCGDAAQVGQAIAFCGLPSLRQTPTTKSDRLRHESLDSSL